MKRLESTIQILIIDDDIDLLSIAKTYLEKLESDFEITIEENPRSGLDLIRNNDFDIVVCDYQMPVLSGLDILKQLRENGNQIPFIIFTGRSREEVAIKALNLGATNFMKKGSEPKSQYTELAHLIKSAVRHTRNKQAVIQYQKELEIRNKIADLFILEADEDIFLGVLDIILDSLSSKFGVFGYIDDEDRYICPTMTREVWDLCKVSDKSLVFHREEWAGIWGRALIEKKLQISNEPFDVPDGHVEIIRAICCPVVYGGKSIGNLMAANKETDYDEEDISMLQTVAHSLAPILNAHLERNRKEVQRKLAVEALREEREKYQELYDNALVGLIRARLSDGTVIECNETFAKMIGFQNTEDIVGKRIIKTIHMNKKDIERVEAELRTGSCITEIPLKLLDGRSVRIRIQAETYFDEDFFEATVIDMTEEYVARELMEYSEKKFRRVFESSPIGLAILDEDGRVLEGNRAILNIYGISELHEILGYCIFQDPNLSDLGRRNIIDEGYYQTQVQYDFSKIRDTSHYVTSREGIAYFDATFVAFESIVNTRFFLLVVNEITAQKIAELRLKESEENWRSLIESSQDIFIRTDSEGTIIFLNRSLSGIPKSELIGQSVYDFIPPQDDIPMSELLDSVIEKGNIVSFQSSKTLYGKEYILEVNIRPIYDFEELSGMLLTISDITEKQKMLQIIKSEEMRYRTLAEDSIQAISIFEDGKCVYVNPAFCNMTGFTDDYFIDSSTQNLVELIHPDDRDRALQQFYQRISGDGDKRGVEYKLIRKDGKIIWVESYSSLITLQETNMVQVLSIDITERKKHEELVEQERRRLFEVLERIPAFVFLATLEGTVEWANLRAKEIFHKELDVTDIESARPHIERPKEIDIERRNLDDMEWTFPSGQTYTIRSTPFIDIDGRKKILHVGIDISERIHFERILKKQKEELSEFVQRISHDLRGMLQVISGRVGLIKGDEYSNETKEIMDIIEMIDSLLKKSVVLADAGLVIGDLDEIDLDKFISQIGKTVVPEDIRLIHESPPRIQGDREKLTQVIINLLRNAIEHGSPNEIRIVSEQNKNYTDLLFINDGEPVSEEVRDTLLSPSFSRTSNRGMGLKIVSRIISAHGWDISLDDSDTTCFRIRIPSSFVLND